MFNCKVQIGLASMHFLYAVTIAGLCILPLSVLTANFARGLALTPVHYMTVCTLGSCLVEHEFAAIYVCIM